MNNDYQYGYQWSSMTQGRSYSGINDGAKDSRIESEKNIRAAEDRQLKRELHAEKLKGKS
ncbi:hypothetical protein CXF85_19820 [Colwellia sp. 75C3]|uniref:hypothetical protein n=1 Tax=Colwellia sp. 75C3 TaxID=888425 RepID=UPI000C334DF7|nr:hypothetical protein [Colwellia sp. 75C3]PKG81013.1 hypothetical protein CXF85_19820 [Colwellia sp. 75C3]